MHFYVKVRHHVQGSRSKKINSKRLRTSSIGLNRTSKGPQRINRAAEEHGMKVGGTSTKSLTLADADCGSSLIVDNFPVFT